jgi:hypothetical protein
VLAAPTLRLLWCLRFNKLVTGMHFECTSMVPSLMVMPMDSCSTATPMTGSGSRLDRRESIAQRGRCLRNVDECA